jgi:hypothetical protein
MKFSLSFCAIEIIAFCFMVPAILMSSYENREIDKKFDGWWKIIGEFCVEFGCRLISSNFRICRFGALSDHRFGNLERCQRSQKIATGRPDRYWNLIGFG